MACRTSVVALATLLLCSLIVVHSLAGTNISDLVGVPQDTELATAIGSVLPAHWKVRVAHRLTGNRYWAEGGMVKMILSANSTGTRETYRPGGAKAAILLFIPREYDPTITNKCTNLMYLPLIARTSEHQVFLFGIPYSHGWTNSAFDIARGLYRFDSSVETADVTDEEIRRYAEMRGNIRNEQGRKYVLTRESIIETWEDHIARLKPVSTNGISEVRFSGGYNPDESHGPAEKIEPAMRNESTESLREFQELAEERNKVRDELTRALVRLDDLESEADRDGAAIANQREHIKDLEERMDQLVHEAQRAR